MGAWDQFVQQGAASNQGGGGNGGSQGGGGYTGGGNQGSFDWQQFLNYRQMISDRNQAYGIQNNGFANYQAEPGSWQSYLGAYNDQNQQQEENHPFSMSGGTESLFNNNYRKANAADTLAIKSLEGGEFFSNLPGEIAGMIGGEQAKKDWSFNPENFNLSNGFGTDDLAEVGKFALSLPGMIPGGLLEGAGKAYEAVTGAPVQENRKTKEGGYEIADYTLDESQRVAAGLDAAIDIGGTFLGGSGRVVGAIGKGLAKKAGTNMLKGIEAAAQGTAKSEAAAARYLSKSDRLAKRAEMLGNASNRMGEGLFDKSGFGKPAQLAFDIGEESGEEFVQSYADDIRNKNLNEGSLDRAMTGAAWGAFGGGLMHGMGSVLGKVVNPQSESDQAGVDPGTAIQGSQNTAFERNKDRNISIQGGQITHAAASRYDEKIREPHESPASTSQFGTTFNDDLGVHESIITDGMLHDMLQADDNGETRSNLANKFHTTAENLVAIDSIENEATRISAWRNLLDNAKKVDGRVKFVAGRNPDTNIIGTADVDIADIVPGHGVQLHSLLYKLLGGDIDGDKYQCYFSPEVRSSGYVTQNLMNTIINQSNLDSDYVSFYNDPQTGRVFANYLKTINNELKNKFTTEERRHHIGNYFKAVKAGDLNAVTRELDSLRSEINKRKADDAPTWFADHAVSGMMKELHKEATKVQRSFSATVKKLTLEEAHERSEIAKLVEQDERFLRSGDNRGKVDFADIAAYIGAKIYINTGISIGNPIMRQSATYRYESKKDEDVWFGEELSSKDVRSRFDNLIAFAFGVSSIGEDVKNSIEGVWRISVMESTLTRFHRQTGGEKVDIKSGWDDFLKIFVEEHNKKVKDFNNSLERDTDDAHKPLLVGSRKNTIDINDRTAVAAQFHEVFGNYIIDELLDISTSNPLRGRTFNQIISEYATLPTSSSNNPLTQYKEFSKFFVDLCKDEGRKLRQLGTRYEATFAEIAQKVREFALDSPESYVTVKTNENGETVVEVNSNNDEALFFVIDAANYVFGQDVSIKLGLGTTHGFLTTEYGRMFMSGDEKQIANAVVSGKLSVAFENAIDIATAKMDNWENDLMVELGRLAENGGLFENLIYAACDELGVDRGLGYLKFFTDLDVSISEKNDLWAKLIVDNEGAGPFISEVFASGNTDLGTSAFVKDLKNAKRSITEASKRSVAANVQTLNNIEKGLSNIDPQVKLSAIKHFAQSAYTTMSKHAIASFVHSQRRLVKGMVDKGVAPTSSNIVYQMIEHVKNGDLFSYLESFDLECGTMEVGKFQVNRVQLLNALFDPEFEIRAYDKTQDGYVWISQRAIFEDVLGENYTQDPNTDWDCWVALMRKYPAFVSLLAPTHVGTLTVDGNPSVNEGMSKSLDVAITDYSSESGDVTKQYHMQQLRNEAAQLLFQDSNWWGVLISSVDGLDESQDLATTSKLVEDEIEKHITWVLNYASMNPNGAGYFEKCFSWGYRGFREALGTLNDVINENQLNDFLRRQVGSVYSQAESDLLQGLLAFQYQTKINNLLEAAQIDLEIDLDNTDDEWYVSREDIQDYLDEKGDDVKRAIACILNMLDPKDLKFESFLKTFNGMAAINEQLEEYANQDPQNRAKVDAVKTQIETFTQGGARDLLDFLGLTDFEETITSENAEGGEISARLFDEIIPSSAPDDWTVDQYKEAIDKICKDCNIIDDIEKIKKQVDKAFKKDDRAAKVDIKNYFNQAILTYSLNNLVSSGSTYNPLAAKQTVEAHRTMLRAGDRIRKQMGDRLEQFSGPLPELKFHYQNPVTSYMSAAAVMNAASGSITTGIGLDGSMMKMLAGLGLLDQYTCGVEGELVEPGAVTLEEYRGYRYEVNKPKLDKNGKPIPGESDVKYHIIRTQRDVDILNASTQPFILRHPDDCLCGACKSCMPETYSRSQVNIGWMSKALSQLVNYMQEPLHLKQKKALGIVEAFVDPLKLNKDLIGSYNISAFNGDDYTVVMQAFQRKRAELTDAWGAKFKDAGDALGFNDVHATAFANLMTQLLEIDVVGKDINGEDVTRRITISASELSNATRFQNAIADRCGDLSNITLNQSGKIRPIIMSLQEISTKIVRDVCNKYYMAESNGEKINSSMVRNWAGESIQSLGKYNSNPLKISTFLKGVASQGYRVDMPMSQDSNPTPYMLFQDEQIENLRHFITPKTIEEDKPISERDWNKIIGINRSHNELSGSKNIVARVHVESGKRDPFVAYMSQLPDISKTNENIHTDNTGSYEVVEMFYGESSTEAGKAYRAAAKNGRSILIRTDIVNKVSAIPAIEKTGQVDFQMNGIDYTLIHPQYMNWLKARSKRSFQMPITEMDPDEYSIAIGTKKRLGLADAGHYTKAGYEAKKAFRGATEINVSSLLTGTQAVRLVTDVNEIANIDIEDINFEYYKRLKNKSEDTYQRAVGNYIKMMKDRVKNGLTEMPASLNNVQQDSCVGLVKQIVGGKEVYAPLFYEGSVASNADAVVVRQTPEGTVRVEYSARKVNYSGNESMKLDLYGLAYKSQGHEASPEIMEKWAALDDFGFNTALEADHMFDDNALGSRVFELGDTILQRNVFFFTKKAGINLFFERRDGKWQRRSDLSNMMTDPILIDLANGDIGTWSNVANGSLRIWTDDKANELIARAASESLINGCPPSILFNSARVAADNNGNWNYEGLERRFVDPRIIFKYWNTNDFMYLFNHLDNRLCPPSIYDDDSNCVFDHKGRMLDRNTRSGKPERVTTIIGPHYYTGEGTAIADASRTASWSHQHILKRMLDMGIYPRELSDTIAALGVTTNRYDKLEKAKATEERVKDWRDKYGDTKVTLNENMLSRVSMAINDPVVLSATQRYRESLVSIVNEDMDPLSIIQAKNNRKSVFDNDDMRRGIDSLIEEFNKMLGATGSDAFTLGEIVSLVRKCIGYTNNNGLGINSITYSQFEAAVKTMIENGKTYGHIIVGGQYRGSTNTDKRVSIPLLSPGMNTRLLSTNLYSSYDGDVKKLMEEQFAMLQDDSYAFAKTITDPSKRNAMFKMIDAACYSNGIDTISGHVGDNVYMYDIMESMKTFGEIMEGFDPELLSMYDESCRLNEQYIEKLENAVLARHSHNMILPNGDTKIVFNGDDRTIVTKILRELTAARRALGMSYAMILPGSLLDRFVGSKSLSWAMKLGRMGIGPYRVSQELDMNVRKGAVESGDLIKFWSALREAQLAGVDRELIFHIRSGKDLDTAISETFKERGRIEQVQQKFMNIMSGKDAMIKNQILAFLDRFWQRSETEAPWWHQTLPGQDMTIFEQRLASDPAGLMMDIFNGNGAGKAADVLLARQCMEFAKAGDMAQKNLASAIMSEIAGRSALADFAMTTLVTPYFQYATNRMGRVLQWIAPISSLHYVLTDFFSKGIGSTFKFGEGTFGDLGLDDVQVKASLKEAMWCDMCHLGPGLVAMLIVGMMGEMSGLLQPPEDDKKRGDFREWTFMGMRIEANWWIEDSLGLALPLACFFASCSEGYPRIDLIWNGLSHYLSNNPVAKVTDAVSVLFDPMAELYREYDKNLEGYAKAMGGPPDPWTILKGKVTSFGLSYVSQFLTPGFLREIYNASQGNEVSYKRIYETDATGKLSMDARENNKTQYTSYEDAVIRKYTKNNPVMGFLADIVKNPETGYMHHEMPDLIIYDPAQMNSIEAFSLYEDPYTKKVQRPYQEQLAIGYMVIAALQSNDVEDLRHEGFMIDYDTKKLVSQMIWDMIATENDQWAELEQSGALNYYNLSPNDPYGEGARIASEMKQAHYNYTSYLKSLYTEKLWSDALKSPDMYNQRHTTYRQDVNGDVYATGYYPNWWTPVTLGPGETAGDYQYVMSPQNDWATESTVTGESTGIRGLIPVDKARIEMPDKPTLQSWSEDGSETGHSELYNKVAANGLLGNDATNNSPNSNNTKSGYPTGSTGGYRRSGGGGGGYRRGGGGGGYRRGGGGGGGYVPNVYAPSVEAPTSSSLPRQTLSKTNVSRIMDNDRLVDPNVQYLRPDFETKGSREAYKRSDI